MSVINDPYDEIVAKIFGSLEYLAYLHGQPFGTIKSTSDYNALKFGSFSIPNLAKFCPKKVLSCNKK